MTTEEIFESIDAGSHLTFDYCVMTFVASLIAAIGLLTDSSVSVVASMLVSPLMGQILAVTWGITMGDMSLIYRGVRNETVGVLLCFGVGLLVGACTGPFFGPANLTVDWATGNLTSFEISSRGSPWSLIGGGMVAIPSGIGVALALTGGGINALVGVAISAALLPPIVNSGLCLSLAFWFSDDGYNEMGLAYYHYSLWSFLLFVVNFVLIIILALGVFKNIPHSQAGQRTLPLSCILVHYRKTHRAVLRVMLHTMMILLTVNDVLQQWHVDTILPLNPIH